MSTWISGLKRVLIGVLVLSGVFVWSCRASAQTGNRPAVFVSIAPQKYFVQKVGKERVHIQVMVPAAANPAIYEPRPRQMAAVSKAQNFAIGVAVADPLASDWAANLRQVARKLKAVLK